MYWFLISLPRDTETVEGIQTLSNDMPVVTFRGSHRGLAAHVNNSKAFVVSSSRKRARQQRSQEEDKEEEKEFEEDIAFSVDSVTHPS